jgi:hypothetical protein
MSSHTDVAIDVGNGKKRSRELKNPPKQRRKNDASNGFDEIESLFAEKKQQKREQKGERTSAPQQRRKDDASNGFDEIESLFAEKKQQKREQKGERTSAPQQSSSSFKEDAKGSRTEDIVSKKCSARWTDDGLGGKYDPEGKLLHPQ